MTRLLDRWDRLRLLRHLPLLSPPMIQTPPRTLLPPKNLRYPAPGVAGATTWKDPTAANGNKVGLHASRPAPALTEIASHPLVAELTFPRWRLPRSAHQTAQSPLKSRQDSRPPLRTAPPSLPCCRTSRPELRRLTRETRQTCPSPTNLMLARPARQNQPQTHNLRRSSPRPIAPGSTRSILHHEVHRSPRRLHHASTSSWPCRLSLARPSLRSTLTSRTKALATC